MLETIKSWDEKLFLFLNNQHIDWLDPVVYAMTGKLIWLPLYLFLAFLIIKHFKKGSIWIFAGMGVAILFSDQLASGLMKPYFERLRPCHDPRWEDLIFNYKRCGGMYGFVSSHASNTFALATYMTLVFRRKAKGLPWLFLWAAIVSYTRIYLGVHYPADILIGGLVGVIAGWLAWWIIQHVKIRLLRWGNKMAE